MLTAMLTILAVVTIPSKLQPPQCSNPNPSSAYFLKLEGIPGDSRDTCHKDEIEALGFQSSGSSMTVVKKIDRSTPGIMIAVLSGKHVPEAVLTVYERGAQPRAVVYKMKNVLITSFDQSVGSTGSEQIVLQFQTLETQTMLSSAASPASPPAPGFTMAMNVSTAGPGSFVVTSLNDGATGGQFRDFSITKPLDAASTKLMHAFQMGQHIPEVTITLTPASGEGTLNYKLSDVMVTADTQSGNATSQAEQVRLKPAKVLIEYRSNTRPPVNRGWDVKQNKAV